MGREQGAAPMQWQGLDEVSYAQMIQASQRKGKMVASFAGAVSHLVRALEMSCVAALSNYHPTSRGEAALMLSREAADFLHHGESDLWAACELWGRP